MAVELIDQLEIINFEYVALMKMYFHKFTLKCTEMIQNIACIRYIHPEYIVLSSFSYNKTNAFFLSTAYILPAEFTIMECSLLCPKQLINSPQLQLPPSAFSSSHPPFMSLIDPWLPECWSGLALHRFVKTCQRVVIVVRAGMPL